MYQCLYNLNKANDQGVKRFCEQTNMIEIFYCSLIGRHEMYCYV